MVCVYLSGPITAINDEGICAWRSEAKNLLANSIATIDPTRQLYDPKTYYDRHSTATELLNRAEHGKLIIYRNFNDIGRSSMLLANLLRATDRASIGTSGEIHWAFALKVPVVIIRQPTGNIHDHAMLNAISMHQTENLEAACEFINQVFCRF